MHYYKNLGQTIVDNWGRTSTDDRSKVIKGANEASMSFFVLCRISSQLETLNDSLMLLKNEAFLARKIRFETQYKKQRKKLLAKYGKMPLALSNWFREDFHRQLNRYEIPSYSDYVFTELWRIPASRKKTRKQFEKYFKIS